MKLNRIFALIIICLTAYGCSQPIGNSLLTSSSSGTSTTSDNGTTTGQIEISADNSDLVMNVDQSDKIEITGKCTDLDRKKNRILVEVFAGEDETATPYISNSISDKCQTTGAGLTVGDSCFWVTKGVGIIEGPPVNRSFPQCHDGVFGFAVKLGKILENPSLGSPPLRYTVRFKLRTLEGLLVDSQWSKVMVTRNLNNPTIDKVTADQTLYSCALEMSPTRFNLNMHYALTRTITDIRGTSAPGTIFSGKDTSIITTNDSVFSWSDDNNPGSHSPAASPGVLGGVTYNYTLTSTDSTFYTIPYVTPQTQPSNVLSCKIEPPQIYQPAQPAAGNCYMAPYNNRVNPGVMNLSVSLEWGVSGVDAWTGVNSDANAGFLPAGCNPQSPQTNCTVPGLTAGTPYYFAVRERNVAGQIGKWSNIIRCQP